MSNLQMIILMLFNFLLYAILSKILFNFINTQTEFNLMLSKTFKRLVDVIEKAAQDDTRK